MLTELKKLAAEFPAKPLTRGREMRELLEHAPGEFCAAAMEVLGGGYPERVQRYLVALLWTNNLLIPCITAPETSSRKAEEIATLARRVDPQLPGKLIGYFVERSDVAGPECLDRILGLLRSMPDAANFRPLLMPLLGHPDSRIRSKIALLLGEGNRNLTWFNRRMQEDDSRVRANAIESGAMTVAKDLHPVFQSAISDSNNRVVGNALLGLYRLGDPAAIAGLYDLTLREDPAFRATGVWGMGETGDTRFLPVLTRILTTPNETIKAAALKAIRKLRVTGGPEPLPLQVKILGEPQASGSSIEIPFTVFNGAEIVPGIAATCVRPRFNGEYTYRYSVAEQSCGRKSVAFLVARPGPEEASLGYDGSDAVGGVLQHRRPGEAWLVAQYSNAVVKNSANRPETLFGIRIDPCEPARVERINDARELRAAFDGRRPAGLLDLDRTFQEACEGLRRFHGRSHLFLLGPTLAEPEQVGRLIQVASELRVTVHAICRREDTEARRICRATGGWYATSETVAETLSQFLSGISHRFLVSCSITDPIQLVQIEVLTADRYGESAVIELTAQT